MPTVSRPEADDVMIFPFGTALALPSRNAIHTLEAHIVPNQTVIYKYFSFNIYTDDPGCWKPPLGSIILNAPQKTRKFTRAVSSLPWRRPYPSFLSAGKAQGKVPKTAAKRF